MGDHINRCTRCGDYGCFGTCTENEERYCKICQGICISIPDIKPTDGDSYDDARWATLMEWADEEGDEA